MSIYSLTTNYKYLKIFLILLAIILLLGLTFRFINIDKKAYWDDEAFTSLRISGYTEFALVEEVAELDKISVKNLHKYQTTNAEKNVLDTIKSLALENPQHPPLYYIIARFWVQLFGNSVATLRTLSALISLLVLPSVYWLCWELFASSLTAWVAVALMGISPFHILYAQEAREYMLWIVTIILSSAILLHAMRLKTKRLWGIYAITVALSLYVFPSSVIVTATHGIYVLIIEGFRWTQRTIAFLLASVIALITFIPWLFVIISSLSHIHRTVGGQGNISTLSLVKIWVFNLSRIFVDSNYDKVVINFGVENYFTHLVQILIILFILFISGYAIYLVYCRTAIATWLLILLLIFVTSLPIMLKDVVVGGAQSIILRYLAPAYLSIQISVAYLLTTGITSISRQQKLWQIIACIVFSFGVLSGVISSQANYWWTKSNSDVNFYAAKLINQANRPLLVSDASMGMILGLSHQLNPQVQLRLKPYCHTCRFTPPALLKKNLFPIPEGFDVFLFAPSPELLKKAKQYDIFKIKLVGTELWRLTRV